jgi:hypothetical protein
MSLLEIMCLNSDKRSAADQIFCDHQILEKGVQWDSTISFIDFKRGCDSYIYFVFGKGQFDPVLN